MTPPEGLSVTRWEHGDPVVLVHGSPTGGIDCWSPQAPLASRGFALIIPDRRGYGLSPPSETVDFDTDAEDVAGLLAGRAHLIGWSYGGVVALLAAAHTPGWVTSLVLVEPSAFSVAIEHPEVKRFVNELAAFRTSPDRDALIGSMPSEQSAIASRLIAERPSWEADIPHATLRACRFPKLVVSGAHNVVFETVADTLAEHIDASRAIVPSPDHAVQHAPGFNRIVERFLRDATTAAEVGEASTR